MIWCLLLIFTLPLDSKAQSPAFSTCGIFQTRGRLQKDKSANLWLEIFPNTTKRYFVRLLDVPAEKREELEPNITRDYTIRVVNLGGSRVTKAIWSSDGKAIPAGAQENFDPVRLEEKSCLKNSVDK